MVAVVQEGRIVLMPQGKPVRAAAEERLAELLLECGADLSRMLDTPNGDVARFARHVARSRVLPAEREPLVVLTRTTPLVLSIFRTRRVLEDAVPELGNAAWVVFYDPEDDPFFGTEASSHGVLDAALDAAPVWTTYRSGEFLVLAPMLPRGDFRSRIEDVLIKPRSTSTPPK